MHKGKNLLIIINRRETGRKITDMILSNGYTVKTLADRIGLAEEQSVYLWCKGEVIPSSDYLLALAVEFDLDIRDIIDYTDLR